VPNTGDLLGSIGKAAIAPFNSMKALATGPLGLGRASQRGAMSQGFGTGVAD